MKYDSSMYGGFMLFKTLLGLTALSIAISIVIKWYSFSYRQHLALRKQQCAVYCVDAFLFWIQKQPDIQSCIGTWYAYRKQNGSSNDDNFSFIRDESGMYDFKICVDKAVLSVENSIVQQSNCGTDVLLASTEKDQLSQRAESLAIHFYNYGKKYCFYTFFLPVASSN
jgi:hypothetical protein